MAKFNVGDKAVYNVPTDEDFYYDEFKGSDLFKVIETEVEIVYVLEEEDGRQDYEIKSPSVTYKQTVHESALTKI